MLVVVDRFRHKKNSITVYPWVVMDHEWKELSGMLRQVPPKISMNVARPVH